jgi:DNA-binding response OmpR family regulator
MKKKLWIIEDLIDLHPVYLNIFQEEDYEVVFYQAFDAFSSAYQSEKNCPDLIVADIMLQDGHFIKLLNDSDITLNTPYLVISSSDDIESMRSAFTAGAIDYLIKPFNYNEALAKVERHINKITEKNLETSKLLDALNLELSQFTNKEIKIVESFNLSDDKTLHRNEIVKIIWKNIAIHPNTLDVHIYNLRKKLKPYNYGIKAIGNGLFAFTSVEDK